MKKQKVAFIIITWNSDAYIQHCLECIESLKSVSPIIFIADNGSVDKTISIITNFAQKYDNISMTMMQTNMGVTYSRNHLIKQALNDASIDFFCVLDSDAFVNEKAIRAILDEMQANNCYAAVPRLTYSNGILQSSIKRVPDVKNKIMKAIPIKSMQNIALERESVNAGDYLKHDEYAISAFWMLRRDIFKYVGLFDEKFFYGCEDIDMCLRMYQKGFQIKFVKNAKIIHLYQRISHKRFFSKINIYHLKALVWFFKKHKNRRDLHI